ncbi:unnamed protein product [Rangifer tarandus platyrhynchus]|uniref:Uncharacterized protein n=1 Tax=Rangifer tarandus platyrhynchus TaxID=3082113 RepID=A0AC59YVP2_RANTA
MVPRAHSPRLAGKTEVAALRGSRVPRRHLPAAARVSGGLGLSAGSDSCVRPRGRGGQQPLGRDAGSQRRAGRRRARFRAPGPVRHHQAQGSTMDAKKDNPPLKGSKPRGTLLRSVHIAEGAHPERSGRSTLSQRGVSAAPSASVLKPPSTPATLSQEEKEAIQKRAEGRAKVPPKFRDSVKRFFFSPTGALKIIRMGLLIGAFIFFIIAEAPESYIAITILESCIVVFFILIYMLTLQHLMTYLHWPLLDLINSFITAVFLLIVAILAIQEKERRHLFYIGGALCLTAATVCVIDATLVTKTMRNNLKKALGIKMETSRPLTPEPTPPTRTPTRGGPNAPTRAAMKPRSRRGQSPSKAPSPEPSWTPMKTPPTPSSGGSRR